MNSTYRTILCFCCLLLLACADRESSAGPKASQGVVPLSLEDIVANDAGALFAVVETSAGLSFMLPLELCPASAVDLLLEGVYFPRPLTHNLLLAAADSLGIVVRDIVLTLGAEAAPEARVGLVGDGESALMAALGDALALHYASGVPLLATTALVEHFSAVERAPKTVGTPAAFAAARRRARLAQADTTPVEMGVLGLVQSATDLAVVLIDPSQHRAFPVFIGFCQASSIVAILQNEGGPAVRSHQLFVDLLRGQGVSVEYARIVGLHGDTYIGALLLRAGDRSIVLDARPSDAIALALRTGAPVQLARFLLDELGEQAGPYQALFANETGKLVLR